MHYDLDLKGVSGTIYKHTKPMAVFSADAASAVKATQTLILTGSVKVTSVDASAKSKGTSVTCDSMLYKTDDEIVKTSGRVSVVGTAFTLGPFNEIWCANDLSEVASPDQFVSVRHNQHTLKFP